MAGAQGNTHSKQASHSGLANSSECCCSGGGGGSSSSSSTRDKAGQAPEAMVFEPSADGTDNTDDGCTYVLPNGRSSPALDKGWSWMIVLGAWLISFLLSGFTLSFTIVYQELKKHYGGTATQTAWVLATYGSVRMFSSPLVSALCNAYSHRTVAIVGSILNSICMITSGYTPSLNWLYFIFGIAGGFSSNMVYSPPFPVISYYFERRRGLAMALASTGSGLGGVAMAPLIELLFRLYGYTGGMLIIGGLMLNCCVASALLRPVVSVSISRVASSGGHLTFKPSGKDHLGGEAWHYGSVGSFGSFMVFDKARDRDQPGTVDPIKNKHKGLYRHFNRMDTRPLNTPPNHSDKAAEQPCKACALDACSLSDHPTFGMMTHIPRSRCAEKIRRLWRSLTLSTTTMAHRMDLALLLQPDFLLYCIMMMCYYMCFTTTNTFIAGVAVEVGFSEPQVALMLTVAYALDTPSRLISGALFDVHALRSLHVPIMTTVGAAAALSACLLPCAVTVPGLFGLWAVYQFLFNGNQAQQVPLTVEIVGVDKAMSACGLARVFMGVGEILGPTVGGAIKDKSDSYNDAFYVAGASFIIGCVIFQAFDLTRRFQKRRKRRTLDEIDIDAK